MKYVVKVDVRMFLNWLKFKKINIKNNQGLVLYILQLKLTCKIQVMQGRRWVYIPSRMHVNVKGAVEALM